MKTSKLLLTAAGLLLAASTAQAADDKIVIGGALSMTGIQAPLDTPGFNGAQVAVKYLNDNGGVLGKQIEFINIDGKSDPVTVGNVAVELIDKGAELIVAPCDFDFGGPASREAQSAGLVGISTCASDPLYSSWSLGDKQFTLSMWNTTMGAVAADYAVKEKGWKTAYVVTDQCVESAVRDACDLGYLVTLVPDACGTYSDERHETSLRAIKGYCRQVTTDALLEEIGQ